MRLSPVERAELEAVAFDLSDTDDLDEVNLSDFVRDALSDLIAQHFEDQDSGGRDAVVARYQEAKVRLTEREVQTLQAALTAERKLLAAPGTSAAASGPRKR